MKLANLDARLKNLLNEYIYANSNGHIPYENIPASQTLYGWILLRQQDLSNAEIIYHTDESDKKKHSFAKLYTEVIDIYSSSSKDGYSPEQLRLRAFERLGESKSRARIALKLCYYLSQTTQIRQYIDELTQDSDNQETDDVTVDIQSLLRSQNS
ncbi:hypothetical protein [uncultured Cedecea sp.]|uniref:hypothetical protein n=1 Tax=uncultured Cedecea sp. TaxID=988762 RepID=UPI00261601E9|nr:hypothetical protein [uncultured Cedecea sp.]